MFARRALPYVVVMTSGNRRVLHEVLGQRRGDRRRHVDDAGLATLRQGEVQPPAQQLDLSTDTQDSTGELDVLRRQPE
jgi:hypothetical protein